jgi:predicted transcriptional regulator
MEMDLAVKFLAVLAVRHIVEEIQEKNQMVAGLVDPWRPAE